MPQVHLADPRIQTNSSTPSMTVGMTARLGELTIVDDSDRLAVVNLINDLLTANIPVTAINDRQQGLPFQEVYHDFDGKYIHLNSTTLDLESIDPARDLLLEIPGHQLAAYLLTEDPMVAAIERMLAKRFAAFPLSFVVIEEVKGIDNNLLKAYLDRILVRAQSRVQAIWTYRATSGIRFPVNDRSDLRGQKLLGLDIDRLDAIALAGACDLN
jgi:hypothetical protein